jgi:hypothetical protein
VVLCLGEQVQVVPFGVVDLEQVLLVVRERDKDVEIVFANNEFIEPAVRFARNDIDLKTFVIEREAVILHFQKEVFPYVLLLYPVVVIEDESQKKLDDQKEKDETFKQ